MGSKTYTYTVRTECTGTISETWRVTSTRPLDRAAIEDAMTGTTDPDITLNCVEETTGDEENRVVVGIDDRTD